MDDRSFSAAQDFLLSVKTFWTVDVFTKVKEEYQANIDNLENSSSETREIEDLLSDSTTFQYFAWLERHLQRFKYSGRYGINTYYSEKRNTFSNILSNEERSENYLELTPGFELPNYYRSVDIHQHPGGLWGDEIAGLVYERGARTTTPLMGSAHKDLHHRFTDLALKDISTPIDILDMGCGFGKSTKPFYDILNESKIEAIDLSEPCLKLAAHDAAETQRKNVKFRQINALETTYDNESFDLVTSTMLIHELPTKEIGKMFAEAERVLRPGGRMVHLDFYSLPDEFTKFIHYGHSERNNEPFMKGFAELDLHELLTEKGFINISIVPFSEAEGVDPNNHSYWRFPWTLIAADKEVF